MEQKDPDRQEEPKAKGTTKYLRTLVKSGFKGKLVESGQDEPLLESQDVEPFPESLEVSTETRQKATKLLGFIEEYFSRTAEENGDIASLEALSTEDDLEALLEKLEHGGSQTSAAEAPSTQEAIKKQIKLLLALPDVKNYFFATLRGEVESFKKAQPTLNRVSLLQRLRSKIISETTKLYLKDKRNKGKLLASTSATIAHLWEKGEEAQQEEQKLTATANDSTRSWLLVQEMLGYKKDLKEKGFAMTKSRRDLTDRILSDIGHDKKVFLVGSTGTGKTQLAMLVADLVSDHGFEVVSWHQGTTPRDLFGYREISQDEEGKMKSGTKKGPVSVAITHGRIVIHDEYTTGTTRAQLSTKSQMNAKTGQKTRLPGFNGEVFTVEEGYGELFTGNLKDEKTKAREDMDPAILRMLRGRKVPYMPANEMLKVICSELMDDTGLFPLSQYDFRLLEYLTQAAELMQMCHEREFDKLNDNPAKDVISAVFGGRMDEVHLDKSFLDPGTVFDLLKGWELERARGKKFHEFLAGQLQDFLADPKFDMDKQERQLATTILGFFGLSEIAGPSTEESPFIFPSKIGELFEPEPLDLDPEGDKRGENKLDLPAATSELDRKLDAIVEVQYQSALDLIAACGLYNPSDGRCPDKKKVKEQLAKSLTPTQLEEIKNMEEPVLQLIPVRTCEEYVTASNIHKPIVNVDAIWEVEAFPREDARENAQKDKITKWQIAITEGASAPAVPPWDDLSKLKSERIQTFNTTQKPRGVSGISSKSYMLLQMRSSAKNRPIPVDDKNGVDPTWTILNPENAPQGYLGGGCWVEAFSRVDLATYLLGRQDHTARFRSSVVVDVPEKTTELDRNLDAIVESQHQSALDLISARGLYKPSDGGCPDKKKVKEQLAKSLTPTQLEEIKNMKEPILQLIPVRTCDEYVTALNSHKPLVNSRGKRQQDASFGEWMEKAFLREDTRENAQKGKITKWQIAITEGANVPAVQPWDNISSLKSTRIKAFNSTQRPRGILSVSNKSYMLLQMRGFAKNPPRPVDDTNGADRTWTILNPQDIEDNKSGCGYWDDHHSGVLLEGSDVGIRDEEARFRSSVVVDVL